jgi:ClpP class serine protease
MSSPSATLSPIPATADEFIEQQLHERLRAIEHLFTAHALTFNGPLYEGVDDVLRTVVETRCLEPPTTSKLVVLLTTNGGYIEPVQRMVAILRKHYQIVDFVIPNSAYSAGTVFAMSGDAIHMDYYSRLGPIDPQIEPLKGLWYQPLVSLRDITS